MIPAEAQATGPDANAISVQYTDGRTEIVNVRRIPRAEFGEYAMAATSDESLECGFYCGRDADWADRLEDASFDAVLKSGLALNLQNLKAFIERLARKSSVIAANTTVKGNFQKILDSCPELGIWAQAAHKPKPAANTSSDPGSSAPGRN